MKNKVVTVKSIFQEHWSAFLDRHKDELRKVEVDEVEKILDCNHRSCNSRICNSCGKRYTDNWSKNLVTFDVPHKHITLTLSNFLWEPIKKDRISLKVLVDSAFQALNEYYGGDITLGCIVVLHTFGRDLGFKPHLHCIVTYGGFDDNGRFITFNNRQPNSGLGLVWMKVVCDNLRRFFQILITLLSYLGLLGYYLVRNAL